MHFVCLFFFIRHYIAVLSLHCITQLVCKCLLIIEWPHTDTIGEKVFPFEHFTDNFLCLWPYVSQRVYIWLLAHNFFWTVSDKIKDICDIVRQNRNHYFFSFDTFGNMKVRFLNRNESYCLYLDIWKQKIKKLNKEIFTIL